MMRYTLTMGIKKQLLNSILTALFFGVGISTPVWSQTERLDTLFERLLDAEPEDVARIEDQIMTEWSKSASPAMDLLLRRGEDAIDVGMPEVALEHFSALVDHAPNFAEGYNARAAAYYQLGLYGPAIDDLRQVLVLEPRHFGAMIGVAVILEELERPEDALEVWHRVAAFSPSDPEVVAMIERLEIQLSGEAL
ncbi:hypothetical protein Q4555_03835 [Octadecabacter sp. 1_MG-2023]|nr:hypothetical protein [Octadecabacter sp. B2R22]MBU2992765.1 hypothetical protein [Octadecabacter sp. B2R22]MDO6733784.1 hypothetical protein [Octadecabacter sp. 1_MG-2023]